MRIAYPNRGPCPHQSKTLMMSCHRPVTKPAPEMTNSYPHCLVKKPDIVIIITTIIIVSVSSVFSRVCVFHHLI